LTYADLEPVKDPFFIELFLWMYQLAQLALCSTSKSNFFHSTVYWPLRIDGPLRKRV